MQKLPIGIQSFADLRSNHYLYVDKTRELRRLIESGKIYFLSRPRRFGKSLLVSTMEAVFKGEKELFEGLYIYDQWDWSQQYPVVRLDFGGLSYASGEELKWSLTDFVEGVARTCQLSLVKKALPDKFMELIALLHQSTGQKVVVLIDEYDKPITDHLSSPETAEANRQILRSFYQVLKAA
ncbi:MAG: AAA family ATPase, partial [Tannerella sp.]|nr:AAA family ATPase [Tannerella sp.]